MKIVRLLILFLLVSFLVQNTCPYGLAAKTGFAAKEIHHCPMKKHSSKPDDDSSSKVMRQTGQTFVFTVNRAINAAPFSSPKIFYSVSELNIYKNIFSEPPAKPPRFV